MNSSTHFSRRRALQTLFCSSAALALNVRRADAIEIDKNGLHFLAIGDFGTGGADQKRVAEAMQSFVKDKALTPDALLLLGDNFYSKDKAPEGFTTASPRWKKDIEDMYPASVFPGPMLAVLGNHDYHDNAGGQDVQLAYARQPGLRWNLPAKWYRFDLGGAELQEKLALPSGRTLVTFLCLDTNLPAVSGAKNKITGPLRASLTEAEETEQLAWLKAELAKSRGTFTIVLGHHPLYSNGSHGDTKALITQWDDLFQEHKVHAYLCGHDHDLQHLELDGKFTSHVISGGGGARTRELGKSHEVPFGKKSHGFSHLSISGETLRITHYDDAAQPLHTFSKKADGSVNISGWKSLNRV